MKKRETGGDVPAVIAEKKPEPVNAVPDAVEVAVEEKPEEEKETEATGATITFTLCGEGVKVDYPIAGTVTFSPDVKKETVEQAIHCLKELVRGALTTSALPTYMPEAQISEGVERFLRVFKQDCPTNTQLKRKAWTKRDGFMVETVFEDVSAMVRRDEGLKWLGRLFMDLEHKICNHNNVVLTSDVMDQLWKETLRKFIDSLYGNFQKVEIRYQNMSRDILWQKPNYGQQVCVRAVEAFYETPGEADPEMENRLNSARNFIIGSNFTFCVEMGDANEEAFVEEIRAKRGKEWKLDELSDRAIGGWIMAAYFGKLVQVLKPATRKKAVIENKIPAGV